MTAIRDLFVAVLCAAAPVSAQDLLGVAWGGQVVRIDSHSGATVPVGSGLAGLNCLARSASGTYWSVQRLSSTSFALVTVDPNTGAGTFFSGCYDIRGLSQGPGGDLYGVRDGASSDLLVRINTSNGLVTTIGACGFTGIQGLATHQGVLYAWDVFDGLLVVNPTTGAATDPFPGGVVPPYLQSLCSHPDGRLLVGGGDSAGVDSLYVVDVATGATTLLGPMTSGGGGGPVDFRGIEPLGAYIAPYGQGCDGEYGPVVLSVTGTPHIGGYLATTSTNHAANSVGLIVFGGDSLQYLGVPLPLLLDPVFGTLGCTLYTSIDGSFVMVSGPTGPAQMQFGFTWPASAGPSLVHVQHVCLENVPGGMSWSNGVAIRVD